MTFQWHHFFIYALFFLIGAYAVTKVPAVNLIGRVVG